MMNVFIEIQWFTVFQMSLESSYTLTFQNAPEKNDRISSFLGDFNDDEMQGIMKSLPLLQLRERHYVHFHQIYSNIT